MSDLAAGSSGSQIARSALTSHPASAPRPCSGPALLGAGTPSWLLFRRYSVPAKTDGDLCWVVAGHCDQQLGRCALWRMRSPVLPGAGTRLAVGQASPAHAGRLRRARGCSSPVLLDVSMSSLLLSCGAHYADVKC